MLKKSLIVASVLAFAVSSAVYAGDTATCPCQKKEPAKCEKKFDPAKMDPAKKAQFEQKRAEFDQRLNLTDEQKAQAKTIRENGRAQMQPIMEQLKAKNAEAQAVQNSKLAPEAQQAKLDQINADKKVLKGQLREIRRKNMQDFEAILTPDQKKELTKMKEEARQQHKGKKPGCGCKNNPGQKSPEKTKR